MIVLGFDITVILSVLLGVSSGGALLCYLMYNKINIKETFLDRMRDIREQSENNEDSVDSLRSTISRNDLEGKLNDLFDNMSVYVSKSEKIAKANSTSVSAPAALARTVVHTVQNPYNKTSPIKLFILLCLFIGGGLLSAALLENTAVMFISVIMGTVMPFTMINLSGARNRMTSMNSNLHLLSVHLPHYKDSDTVEQAFRRCLASFSPKSAEYKAVKKVLDALDDLNMPMHDALMLFAKEINAGTYEMNYIATIEKAEAIDPKYKQILSSILRNFDSQTTENLAHVNFAYWLYFIYIGAIGLSIAVLFYIKMTMPESYRIMNESIIGKVVVFVVFLIECVMGLIISKASQPITLDLVENRVKNEEEENIYV